MPKNKKGRKTIKNKLWSATVTVLLDNYIPDCFYFYAHFT